jgi:hypothetical protein
MDEKKRCNTDQSDGVSQKPPYCGPSVFTPRNAVIRNQTRDTNDCCRYGSSRTHQDIADHISPAAQPEINLRRTTQYVRCRAITESDSSGANRVAKGHDWLGIKNAARKGIGKTDQKRIPRADAQQERHNQTDGGVPGNEPNPRKENDFRTIQQKV